MLNIVLFEPEIPANTENIEGPVWRRIPDFI